MRKLKRREKKKKSSSNKSKRKNCTSKPFIINFLSILPFLLCSFLCS
jgi:hypothetical protein